MNARLSTPPATSPVATPAHDAALRDIAARFQSISRAILDSLELHHGDRASFIDELLTQSSLEHMRLSSQGEVAWELAGVEAEEDAENRWNAENNGGY